MNYPSDKKKSPVKYPKESPANREWMNHQQYDEYMKQFTGWTEGKGNYIDIGRFRICSDTYENGVVYMIYEYLDFWYGCPERFYIINKDTYELIIENQLDRDKIYEIIINA